MFQACSRGLALTFAMAIIVSSGVAAVPARAETPPADAVTSRPARAVVELFTSQGCSSCPPADRLMQGYAAAEDVLALSLPVDIWDHLGWKDTLADPKNTARQRAYARRFAEGPIYTPQMVINGVAHAVGSRQRAIDDAVEADAQAFASRRVSVRIARQDGRLQIDLGGASPGTQVKPATVWLGTYDPHVEVPIRRGENSGRTVRYSNVVRDMVPIGVWTGEPLMLEPRRAKIAGPGQHTFVLVQEGDHGRILGAASLKR